jgi:hypothetical protein
MRKRWRILGVLGCIAAAAFLALGLRGLFWIDSLTIDCTRSNKPEIRALVMLCARFHLVVVWIEVPNTPATTQPTPWRERFILDRNAVKQNELHSLLASSANIGEWHLLHSYYSSTFWGFHVRALMIPIWLIVPLLLVLPAFQVTTARRNRRRQNIGRCRNCGYDLRATPDRCPECGMVPAGRVEISDANEAHRKSSAVAAAPDRRA